jgi:dCTP deaminase
MPYQAIRNAIRGAAPIINVTKVAITDDQIQPSSLDFRFGDFAFALNSSVVPGRETFVSSLIEQGKRYDFPLSPFKNNVLERGVTYIIKLEEICALPKHRYLEFSPKSSAGRADVFVRVICDRFPHFDVTPAGYHGPLYALVTPLSFNVEIKQGLALVQGRLKTEDAGQLSGKEIAELHSASGLLFDEKGNCLEQKDLHIRNSELYYHLDLQREVIGFAARQTASKVLDLTASGEKKLDPVDFWEPLRRPADGRLVIVPGVFYLLATRERVSIPQGYCAQMNSYDTNSGEYRSHYAGFFDPGFGSKGGTNGVLEVRASAVNFTLQHGHPVCSMRFEKLDAPSEVLYEGNYTNAGPSLSKHFNDRTEAWTKAYWAKRWAEEK